jgi:hypothetical protein
VLKYWLSLFNSDASLDTDGLMKKVKKINKYLNDFLESKYFPDQWNKILLNCKNEQQISYQRKNWFDAFKTLKLIHHLRDNSFQQINMFEAVNKLFQAMNESPVIYDDKAGNPDLNTQKKFLIKLKEIQRKFTRLKITE